MMPASAFTHKRESGLRQGQGNPQIFSPNPSADKTSCEITKYDGGSGTRGGFRQPIGAGLWRLAPPTFTVPGSAWISQVFNRRVRFRLNDISRNHNGGQLHTEPIDHYDPSMRIEVGITDPEPLGGLTPADPARLWNTRNLVARLFEPPYDGSESARKAGFF